MSLFREESIAAMTRSTSRVVCVWSMLLTAMSALALVEDNAIALYIVAIGVAIAPSQASIPKRLCLCAIALVATFGGSPALLVAVPATFLLLGLPEQSVRTCIGLAASAFLAHHLQCLPPLKGNAIEGGSAAFLLVPTLVVIGVHGVLIGWRSSICLLFAAATTLVLLDQAAARWMTHATFTAPVFRAAIALVPVGAAALAIAPQRDLLGLRKVVWIAIAILIGAASTVLIPVVPIGLVVFDESHGRWETTQASFGPTPGRCRTCL